MTGSCRYSTGSAHPVMVGEACPGEGRGNTIHDFADHSKERRGLQAGACPCESGGTRP